MGNYTVILSSFADHTIKVTPFLKSLGTLSSLCICSAAIAYDDLMMGTATLIVLHQAIHIP